MSGALRVPMPLPSSACFALQGTVVLRSQPSFPGSSHLSRPGDVKNQATQDVHGHELLYQLLLVSSFNIYVYVCVALCIC